ncbi:MAG: hypothetical protein ABIV06_10105 [Thermoanaerobaculia bacterium]
MNRDSSGLTFSRFPWPAGFLLALALAWFSQPASATPAAGPSKRSELSLEVSTWILPSRPIEIRIEQSGVLAGRRLAIDLFVDRNQFERIQTTADRTRVSITLPALTPGRYQLMARCGTAMAATEFRVVPWAWIVAPAVAVLGALLLTLTRRRRRRRSRVA